MVFIHHCVTVHLIYLVLVKMPRCILADILLLFQGDLCVLQVVLMSARLL